MVRYYHYCSETHYAITVVSCVKVWVWFSCYQCCEYCACQIFIREYIADIKKQALIAYGVLRCVDFKERSLWSHLIRESESKYCYHHSRQQKRFPSIVWILMLQLNIHLISNNHLSLDIHMCHYSVLYKKRFLKNH